MRNILKQSVHDTMVSKAVQYLLNHGYTDVKADIAGYKRPEKIRWSGNTNGHIPDITAKDNNDKLNLFEAETSDSINSDHSTDQWTLFAAYAKEYNLKFWVVVPRGYAAVAESRLKKLGISAHVWEV